MKKTLSFITAIVLVFALSVSVLADEVKYKVDVSEHTFDAYQIFAGTQDEATKKLVNIVWGDGINYKDFLTALQKTAAYANCKTAADVANILAGFDSDSKEAYAFAKLAEQYIIEGKGIEVKDGKVIPAGYYLVVDTKNVEGEQDAKNLSILQVEKTITVVSKSDYPTHDKKVKDINDTTGAETEWQETADYDIGDFVPFKLIGTIPSDYANYETYYYCFEDKLCDGLDQPGTFTVKVDGTKITNGYTVYTCTVAKEGFYGFKVEFEDLKKIGNVKAGSEITVEFESKLNEKAVIGNDGNLNKSKLVFSNNSNHGGEGDKGETPEEKVVVFTYGVELYKVDEQGNKLTGATFELFKNKGGVWTTLGTNSGTNNKDGSKFVYSWKGLDDGEYKLVETVTPDGYNTIPDQIFTITAEHNDEKIISLNGVQGDDGLLDLTCNNKLKNDILESAVKNIAGVILPTTGGEGTTAIYAVGAVLVGLALVLVFSKKRVAE